MAELTAERIAEIKQEAETYQRRGASGSLIDSDLLVSLCDLATKGLLAEQTPIQRPRRKIVVLAKFEADDWDSLVGTFRQLEFEASRDGGLSSRSVSGGYSTGHIYVCDVDGNMTHDKWADDLNAYLSNLKTGEANG